MGYNIKPCHRILWPLYPLLHQPQFTTDDEGMRYELESGGKRRGLLCHHRQRKDEKVMWSRRRVRFWVVGGNGKSEGDESNWGKGKRGGGGGFGKDIYIYFFLSLKMINR